MANQITTRIVICGDTTAKWGSSSKVLLKNEFGIEITNGTPKIKIGDGVKTWAELDYITMTPEEIATAINNIVGENGHVHANKTILDNIKVALTTELAAHYDAAYTHSQAAHAPAGAEVNQNAFTSVKVGTTTVSSTEKTGTVELIAGTNVTISATKNDGENAKVVINAEGEAYEEATTTTAGLMSATDKSKLNGIESGAQVNTVTGIKGSSESSYRTGQINITKANIGLDKAENTADIDKVVSKPTQAALDKKTNDTDFKAHTSAANPHNITTTTIGAIPTSEKGVANGIATLDESGRIPVSQIPGSVDDVRDFNTRDDFPTTGSTGVIYLAKDTNVLYLWSGTVYVEIPKTLVIGTTTGTAFDGALGQTAYTHSQSQHAPVGAQANVIEVIKKNGVAITAGSSKDINISVPTKVSELTNDSKFLTAVTTDIITQGSDTLVLYGGTAD